MHGWKEGLLTASFEPDEFLRRWLGEGLYEVEVLRWEGERDFDERDVAVAGTTDASGKGGELRAQITARHSAGFPPELAGTAVTLPSAAMVRGDVGPNHPLFFVRLLAGVPAEQRSRWQLAEGFDWSGVADFRAARKTQQITTLLGPLALLPGGAQRRWLRAMPVSIRARVGELLISTEFAPEDGERQRAAARLARRAV